MQATETVQDAFAGVIGNEGAVKRLRLSCEASKRMGVPLGHMLLTGPAGAGKTMLSRCVAREMGCAFVEVNCPSLEAKDTLETLIFNGTVRLENTFGGPTMMKALPTIVLWDESHKMPSRLQNEALKPMLDKVYVMRDGMTIDVSQVQFSFATTNPEKMVQPLKDRCSVSLHLNPYTVAELALILDNVPIEDRVFIDGQWVPKRYTISFQGLNPRIAAVARQTPRLALQLAREYYKFLRAQPEATTPMAALDLATEATLAEFLRLSGIYWGGLTAKDFRYLYLLSESKAPVGVKTLASQMRVPDQELIENVEPLLCHYGFVKLGKSGRELTMQGKQFVAQAKQASQRRPTQPLNA
jgi:Holliday junction resolvasome RuvABC ATP-dependent DNA helicase subunit